MAAAARPSDGVTGQDRVMSVKDARKVPVPSSSELGSGQTPRLEQSGEPGGERPAEEEHCQLKP